MFIKHVCVHLCSLSLPCSLHIYIRKRLFICHIVILLMITSKCSTNISKLLFCYWYSANISKLLFCFSFKLLYRVSLLLSWAIFPNRFLDVFASLFSLQRNRDVFYPNCQHKRSDYGLPEDKFLFACFNHLYKSRAPIAAGVRTKPKLESENVT